MNRWVQGPIRQRRFGELYYFLQEGFYKKVFTRRFLQEGSNKNVLKRKYLKVSSYNTSHSKTSMPSLRQQLRQKRRSLSRGQQQAAADALTRRLTSDLSIISANRIALYQPADGEIDPTIFLNWCCDAGKKIYLPVVPEGLMPNRATLLFQAYIPGETRLVSNKFGNLEPSFNRRQCINVAYLNLVMMPLVGFDRTGNRLGMGKGYYDKTFAAKSQSFRKPKLIGLAHSFQEAVLTPNPWDVPLDAIYTEKEKISY